MMSGMFCDPNDPQELDKLKALKDVGIGIISGFLTISRPYALAPWYTSPSWGYRFDLHNEWYWDHLELFTSRCKSLGLGISFQIINKWWVHEGGYPASVVNNAPTGELATIMRRWLIRLVPIVNSLKFAAILPVTEGGSGSKPMCRWVRETMEAAGVSPFTYWISNSGMKGPGWIESPHPKSVAAWSKPHTFASADGWYCSLSDWKRAVAYQRDHGAAAIEYWSPYLSGTTDGAYPTRQRPSMEFISRKCGSQLRITGEA
jgi:hypothetical protein